MFGWILIFWTAHIDIADSPHPHPPSAPPSTALRHKMNKSFTLVCKTENDETVVHQRTSSPGDAAAVLEVVVGKTIVERLLPLDCYSDVLGVAGRVTGGVEDHRGVGIQVGHCVKSVGRGHLDVDLLGA